MVQVERDFPDNFGTLDAFGYAVTPEDAQALEDHFIGRGPAGIRRLSGLSCARAIRGCGTPASRPR